MPKKYNDQSTKLCDWTTKKLKQEAKAYHELIYGEHCSYGSHDILMYDMILSVLADRGITPREELNF